MKPAFLIAACLSLCALAGGAATPVFPVKYAANSRYLVDQTDVAFPILGRTAWFITSLSAADYRTFLDDTAARGYTAIEFHVINHDPRGNNPPFNGNGDLPFLNRLDGAAWNGELTYGDIASEAPDFTTPNETYWAHVDELLAYAESKGILVFMFPAYVGYAGGEQGWMQEMVANGSTRLQSYGAWVATRYKNQKNLVWMLGGDMGTAPHVFDAAETAAEVALLDGVKSVAERQSTLFSAQWASGSISTDQISLGSSMTLNGAYSWTGDVSSHGRRAYARTPVQPAFLLEEPFDEEGTDGNSYNPSATQPVRRFQWWGWLSTIGGYVAGNGYIWPFGTNNAAEDWRNHLNTPGSQDMARLNTFIRTIPWYNLVPSGLDGVRSLITAGGSTVSASDYVAAAATPDGTLLVAYVPPDHSGTITVDVGVMAGSTRARWFDPTAGSYTDIATGLTNAGTYTFNPPTTNSAGGGDWALVLDAVAPGTPVPTIELTVASKTPPDIAQGGFKLFVAASKPGTYVVEATTNFVDWEILSLVQYTNDPIIVTDPGLPPAPTAFYRVAAVSGAPDITLAAVSQTLEQIATNGFRFLINSTAPAPLRIERSTDALTWEMVGSLDYTNGPVDFSDRPFRTLPFRFYRARQQ